MLLKMVWQFRYPVRSYVVHVIHNMETFLHINKEYKVYIINALCVFYESVNKKCCTAQEMRHTPNRTVRTDWPGTTHFVTHMNFNKESPNFQVLIGVKLN